MGRFAFNSSFRVHHLAHSVVLISESSDNQGCLEKVDFCGYLVKSAYIIPHQWHPTLMGALDLGDNRLNFVTEGGGNKEGTPIRNYIKFLKSKSLGIQ